MNLEFIYERTALNQYERIDYLVDNFSDFVDDDVADIPIFYRNDMIIVRRSFLFGLLKASSTENSMRIAIYMVISLMVLHVPVISKKNADCEGITRKIMVKELSIHRNDFAAAMNVLMKKWEL